MKIMLLSRLLLARVKQKILIFCLHHMNFTEVDKSEIILKSIPVIVKSLGSELLSFAASEEKIRTLFAKSKYRSLLIEAGITADDIKHTIEMARVRLKWQ